MIREFSLVSNNKTINIITHNLETINGIIIHLHGLGSNFQYDTHTYNDFDKRVEFFSKINLLSYGLEFEGHGKSSGENGYIEDFDNLIKNFESLYQYIRYTHSNKPIFVIAESMGACVIIKANIIKFFEIKGIILLAPLCGIAEDIKPSNFLTKTIINLSYYYPKYKLIGTKNMDEGCSNKKYNLLKQLNEYAYKGKFMLSTGRECFINSNFIFENKEQFNIPILAIHSKTDKVTCHKKTIDFINKIASSDKEIFILDKGNHTLLVPLDNNDMQPYIILSKILNWINLRI